MTPNQQSLYGQMPAAREDAKEETYLQMMNDLAEEECNAGPQQFQHSRTTGFPGNQYQYASHNVSARDSSHQMPASRQQHYNSRDMPTKRPNYPNPVGRHHPYPRPNVPTPARHYQMSAFGNQGIRQTGPIRHSGNVPNGGLKNSQLGFNHQEPPARQHFSKDYEGNKGPYPPLHDGRDSNFTRHGPSQDSFGNEHFPLQHAAYVQRAATTQGPSPYSTASSNAYAASHASTSVAASEHESRPATGSINLEQTPEFYSVEKEAEKPEKGKKKKATKVKGSNEEKKPAKSKVKGQTRFQNGRLECVSDPDARVQQWKPSIRMLVFSCSSENTEFGTIEAIHSS